jgi:glyoxylase-like metal-dependent hydrolase (beta-lactamase superfamily II)
VRSDPESAASPSPARVLPGEGIFFLDAYKTGLKPRFQGVKMARSGELEEGSESQHPGWQTVASVVGARPSFLEKFLFLPSFDTFCSNIYIILGDYLTIVDPGNDYTAFMDLFGPSLKHKPANIKRIVLTHGHPDHAMGALELSRYPGISQDGDLEVILHEAAPAQLKAAVKEFGWRVTEVRGGERVEFSGSEWEVIHTPGHTIDGICLYHGPTKTAFTGDMVLPHAMAEPDKSAGGRLDHYLFGLKALLKRDIENVLPGHGVPVVSEGRRVIEETYEGVMMKIIGVKPGTPWIEGATALAQRGLLEEAVFCCDRALARDPQDVRALRLRALCLNDLGRCQEALEALQKLQRVGSPEGGDVLVLIGKGYALLGLARYEESIRFFDEALKIKPGMKDALMYKGMALYLAGKCDEAMEIEHFRTEFVGRFKEELLKRTRTSGSPSPTA